MDAAQVKTFCDVVAPLIVPLSTYATTEVSQRKPADDALVRQLRISASAIPNARDALARMLPPPMPPMPPMPAAPNVGTPS
jgi:hypothetical protein